MDPQPTGLRRRRRRWIFLNVTGLTTLTEPPGQWERDLVEPLLKDVLDPQRVITEAPDAPTT